ncbi:MAG: D-aminoacyl-tRNA deacylase [Clostridiales bacterium]|nr:D-aminoacyl-tRNA deacylase [Clostridiales bacterium]
MRAVIQRVTSASVEVSGEVIGKIGKGLLVFLGVGDGDTEQDLNYIADKTVGLRIFSDEDDKMNLSVTDVNGEILVVSQFTLYGDCRKGRRPNFTSSMEPKRAQEMYEMFIDRIKGKGISTEHGSFGADMQVKILNDGPVTILLDSSKII